MIKDDVIYVRVDQKTKEEAERLADSLGINVSQLIRLLLKQNSLLYILDNTIKDPISKVMITESKRIIAKENKRKAKQEKN